MNIKEVLFDLSALPGVSGIETAVSARAAEYLRPLVDEVSVDRLGNLVGVRRCGIPGAKLLLLDAHLDEIGLAVTEVTEDGFLRFYAPGFDPRTLLARRVDIHAKGGILRGVICTSPPHLMTAEDESKAADMSDMVIDTGLKERARELIRVGDRASMAGGAFEMQDFICGKAMDDRAGFAALLFALDELKNKKLYVDIVVAGSTQEEVGTRGVKVAAYNAYPDYAIVVDVTHAKTPDAQSDTMDAGGGPIVEIGPNMHRGLTAKVVEAAKIHDIKYQTYVAPGQTGTNAWAVQISREGVACSLISLPLKYMHTPVECLKISDIENAGRLIARFIERFDGRV